jgi:hypothetical protein
MVCGVDRIDAMIEFDIPVKTVNELNAHEHWRMRQRRAKEQRKVAYWHAIQKWVRAKFVQSGENAVVTLRRASPGELDSDGHVASHKHVRDGLADALGLDDRDQRVTWMYGEQIRSKKYFVRVRIDFACVAENAVREQEA